MNKQTTQQIALDALWHNNATLVHCLALCPLLVMSSNSTQAFALGTLTLGVLLLSSLLIALVRPILRPSSRWLVYTFVLGALVSITQLLLQTFAPQWQTTLGIFIALIAANGLLLMQAEDNAQRDLKTGLLHSLFAGIGFFLLIFLMGCIRELLGTGQLFADMHTLFGQQTSPWTITVWQNHPGFLSLGLAPGAFLIFALLLALKNVLDSKQSLTVEKVDTESRRKRVTGRLA